MMQNRGLLPKPTVLELDEYDINQRIIEALTTVCSHAVLFSIINKSKDAVTISKELQLSLSTVYKTLSNLERLSLVIIDRFEITNEGKKIKQYKSKIMNTPIGEISDPIMLPGSGILIFKVRDKKTIEENVDLEKAKNQLINLEKQKILDMYSMSHYDKLRRSTAVKFLQ